VGTIEDASAAAVNLRGSLGNFTGNVDISGVGTIKAAQSAAQDLSATLGSLGGGSVDFSGAAAQLSSMAADAQSVASSLGAASGASFGGGGSGGGGFGALIPSAAVAAGLGAGLKTGWDNAIGLEQALTNVQATLGNVSASDMSRLSTSIIQIGVNSQYSGVEIAGISEELAKAGYGVDAQINGKMLPAVVDLASATGTALPQAITGVTQAMAIWSPSIVDGTIAMTDASRAADILTVAANASSADVGDIIAGVRNLGPIAAQMHVPFEQVAGAVAMFTNYGLKGADAGVSLARGLQNLNNPTSEASQLMGELGINVFDAQGSFVGFPTLFESLQTSMAGMTDQQKLTNIGILFGAEAQDVFTQAIAAGKDPLLEITNAMKEHGVASEQAAKRQDTLNFALQRLGEGLGTSLGSLFTPFLGPAKAFIDIVANTISSISQLSAPIRAVLGVLLTVGAAIAGWSALSAVTGIISGIVGALGGLSGAAAGAGTALEAVGGGGILAGIGAAIPVILAVAAALGVLYLAYKTNFLGFGDGVRAVGSGVKSVFNDVTGEIGKFTDALTGANPKVDALNKTQRAWVDGMRAGGATQEQVDGYLRAQGVSAEYTQKKYDLLNKSQRAWVDGLRAGGATQEQIDGYLRSQGVSAEYTTNKYDKLRQTMTPLAARTMMLADAFDAIGWNTLADGTRGTVKFFGTLKDSFNDLIKTENPVAAGFGAIKMALFGISGDNTPAWLVNLGMAMGGAEKAVQRLTTGFTLGRTLGLNPFQSALLGLGTAIPALTPLLNVVSESTVHLTDALTAFRDGDYAQGFRDIGSAAQTIGSSLRNLVVDIGGWVLNVGAPAIGGWLSDHAGDIWGAIKDLAGWAGGLIGNLGAWTLDVAVPALTGWLSDHAGDMWSALKTAAGWGANVVGDIAGWVLNVGVPALTGWLSDHAGDIWGALKDAAGWVWDNVAVPLGAWTIDVAVPAVTGWLKQEAWPALKSAAGWAWENVAVPLGAWTVNVAVPAVTGWLKQDAWPALKAAAGWAWENVAVPLGAWTVNVAAPTVVGWLGDGISSGKDFLVKQYPWLGPVIDGIESYAGTISAKITTTISQAADAAMGAFNSARSWLVVQLPWLASVIGGTSTEEGTVKVQINVLDGTGLGEAIQGTLGAVSDAEHYVVSKIPWLGTVLYGTGSVSGDLKVALAILENPAQGIGNIFGAVSDAEHYVVSKIPWLGAVLYGTGSVTGDIKVAVGILEAGAQGIGNVFGAIGDAEHYVVSKIPWLSTVLYGTGNVQGDIKVAVGIVEAGAQGIGNVFGAIGDAEHYVVSKIPWLSTVLYGTGSVQGDIKVAIGIIEGAAQGIGNIFGAIGDAEHYVVSKIPWLGTVLYGTGSVQGDIKVAVGIIEGAAQGIGNVFGAVGDAEHYVVSKIPWLGTVLYGTGSVQGDIRVAVGIIEGAAQGIGNVFGAVGDAEGYVLSKIPWLGAVLHGTGSVSGDIKVAIGIIEGAAQGIGNAFGGVSSAEEWVKQQIPWLGSILDGSGSVTGDLKITLGVATDAANGFAAMAGFKWPPFPTNFTWPKIPSSLWTWPEIPTPGWVSDLIAAFGGGKQIKGQPGSGDQIPTSGPAVPGGAQPVIPQGFGNISFKITAIDLASGIINTVKAGIAAIPASKLTALQQAGGEGVTAVSSAASAAINAIPASKFSTIGQSGAEAVAGLSTTASAAINTIPASKFSTIGQFGAETVAALSNAATGAVNAIPTSWFTSIVQAGAEVVAGSSNAAQGAIQAIPTSWFTSIAQAGAEVVAGSSNAAQFAVSAIPTSWFTAITEAGGAGVTGSANAATSAISAIPTSHGTSISEAGSGNVIGAANGVASAVNSIPSSKTVVISVVRSGVVTFAKGGTVPSSGLARMAELGPELLRFPSGKMGMAMNDGLYGVPPGTFVHTAAQTKRKLSTWDGPAYANGGYVPQAASSRISASSSMSVNGGGLLATVNGIVAGVQSTLQSGMQAATSTIQTSTTAWPTIVGAQQGSMTSAGTLAVGGLQPTVQLGMQAATNAIETSATAWPTIVGAQQNPMADAGTMVGTSMSEGAAAGIAGAGWSVSNAAVSVVGDAIAAANAAAGIASPSTEMIPVGEYMDAGLAQGIYNGQSAVVGAAVAVAQAAMAASRMVMAEDGSYVSPDYYNGGLKGVYNDAAAMFGREMGSLGGAIINGWEKLTDGFWKSVSSGMVQKGRLAEDGSYVNPGFAAGGRVQGIGKNISAWMGERGPELVRMPNGLMGMAATEGLYQVPNGTFVYTAAQTKQLTQTIGGAIKGYARGGTVGGSGVNADLLDVARNLASYGGDYTPKPIVDVLVQIQELGKVGGATTQQLKMFSDQLKAFNADNTPKAIVDQALRLDKIASSLQSGPSPTQGLTGVYNDTAAMFGRAMGSMGGAIINGWEKLTNGFWKSVSSGTIQKGKLAEDGSYVNPGFYANGGLVQGVGKNPSAWMGELGPELVRMPNGLMGMAATEGLYQVPKGAFVYTADQTRRMTKMLQTAAIGAYANGGTVGLGSLPSRSPAYMPSAPTQQGGGQTFSAPVTITINGDVHGIDDFERKIGDVATRVIVPELQRAIVAQRRGQGM